MVKLLSLLLLDRPLKALSSKDFIFLQFQCWLMLSAIAQRGVACASPSSCSAWWMGSELLSLRALQFFCVTRQTRNYSKRFSLSLQSLSSLCTRASFSSSSFLLWKRNCLHISYKFCCFNLSSEISLPFLSFLSRGTTTGTLPSFSSRDFLRMCLMRCGLPRIKWGCAQTFSPSAWRTFLKEQMLSWRMKEAMLWCLQQAGSTSSVNLETFRMRKESPLLVQATTSASSSF